MQTRIQRERTPGWTAPLDNQGRRPVYVGRRTRWGNPWTVDEAADGWIVTWVGPGGWRTEPLIAGTRNAAHQIAAELYHEWLTLRPDLLDLARTGLAGRNLMCWCPLPEPGHPDHCHAAVLLDVANQRSVQRDKSPCRAAPVEQHTRRTTQRRAGPKPVVDLFLPDEQLAFDLSPTP